MLIVICGATATGKSGLGLALAQKLKTVILSADSRQVYREFDIGTAKPTLTEQQQVPHYLIDICDPTQTLTLAEYQSQAQKLIEAKYKEQQVPPLLVGGTGLYLKSIVKGLKIPRVSPQGKLRSQLESLGQVYCYNLLSQVDPALIHKIHPNDQVRTLRALEVFYVTGQPISQQQGESPPNYPMLQIGLHCDSSSLDHRISQRTHQMIERGLVEEVERLGTNYGWDLPLLKTLGYEEIKQYVQGEISLERAIELTCLHTRQFAKRQRTWFKRYPDIEWLDAQSPDLFDEVWMRVQQFTRLL